MGWVDLFKKILLFVYERLNVQFLFHARTHTHIYIAIHQLNKKLSNKYNILHFHIPHAEVKISVWHSVIELKLHNFFEMSRAIYLHSQPILQKNLINSQPIFSGKNDNSTQNLAMEAIILSETIEQLQLCNSNFHGNDATLPYRVKILAGFIFREI